VHCVTKWTVSRRIISTPHESIQSIFLAVTICPCNVSTVSRSLQRLGPTGTDAMTRVQLQKPNMETKYTLIMRDNGSVVQLMEDGPVPPVVPGVFLVLGFTFGLSLNLVTACTIMMSPVLRRVSFNRIVLHLCVSCALDCTLNLLAAVGFVVVTRKYRKVLTKRRCEDDETSHRHETLRTRARHWSPSGLRQGSVAVSCEHIHETAASVESWYIFGQISNCWFLKKDSAPRR
jgi:hypothetical protein